jgi:hypothetical protein
LGRINSVSFPSIAGVDGVYSNILGTTTSGEGVDASFTITVSGDFVSNVEIGDNSGKLYQVGDTITINQSEFGGSEDLILVVNTLNAEPIIRAQPQKKPT